MNINLEYQIMKKGHINRPHAAESLITLIVGVSASRCKHNNLIKVWKLS